MNTFARISLVVSGGLWLAGCHSAAPASPNSAALAGAKTGGAATRRNVKTTMDADAALINKTAQDTTIEDILAQKPPTDGKLAGRIGPFETSTWRVQGKLESIQLMKDGDYYLVMKGAKGGEAVVEVPDPKECANSPLAPEITAARKELEDRYHPTTEVKKLDDDATITGVGFLGWGGSSKGAKGRSGSRLMPGTKFDFGKK